MVFTDKVVSGLKKTLPMDFSESQIEKLKKVLLSRVRIVKKGCWEWTGAKNNKGYGHLGFYGKTYIVPRIAYRVFKDDPGTMAICHSCDNPPCFYPPHLFKGTMKDNSQDSIKKGRARAGWTPGSISGHAKLTDEKVIEMRRLYKPRIHTTKMLSDKFGVSLGCVIKAVRGETWKHLACGK